MPSTAEWLAAEPNIMGSMTAGSNFIDNAYEQMKKAQDDQAQTAAGKAFVAGDYAGATAAYGNNGDVANAQKMQATGQAANSKGIEYLTKALPVLTQIAKIHAAEGPQAQSAALVGAFDHIAPEAKQLTGISDQVLMGLRQSLAADPQGTLQRLQAMIPTEFHNVGDTMFATQNGNVTNSYTGQKLMDVGPGHSLIPYGGATAQPGAVQSNLPPSPQGAPAAGSAASSQPPSANAAAALDYFQKAGWSPQAAAGIVGNLQYESGLDPNKPTSTPGENGFGIAQWSPARAQQFQQVMGKPLQGSSMQDQLAFVNWELTKGPYASVGDALKQTTDPRAATDLVLNKYENPANPAASQATREGYATGYMGQPTQLAQSGQTATDAPSGMSGAPAPQANGVQPIYTAPSPEEVPLGEQDLARFHALPGSTRNSITGAITRATATNSAPDYSPDQVKSLAYEQFQNGGKPLSGRDQYTNRIVNKAMNAPISQGGIRPDAMSPQQWANLVTSAGISTKGKTSAAQQLAKLQSLTAINEGAVNNSIKIVERLLPTAASRGKFTDVNAFMQYLGRKTNDAGAVNLANGINTIANEYARIMTGSTSGAPTSDAARDDAKARILTGYNAGTIQAALDQMRAEMRGRSDAQTAGISALTSGLFSGIPVQGQKPQGPQPPGGGSNGVHYRYDKQGNRIQ